MATAREHFDWWWCVLTSSSITFNNLEIVFVGLFVFVVVFRLTLSLATLGPHVLVHENSKIHEKKP